MRTGFLAGINPLAKIAGVVPAIIVVFTTRDVLTPLAFLLTAFVALAIGARYPVRVSLLLYLGLPLFTLVAAFTIAIGSDASVGAGSPVLFSVAGIPLYADTWMRGLATSLRLAAVVTLGAIAGAGTSGEDLVRASVQHLRVPYRFGYTALAGYRFVPRFAHELQHIRSAHRVRGVSPGRGPIAGVNRGVGYAIPLLAGGIRHAERVALAMDSRGFGAHPTRTERRSIPFRARDAVFVAVAVAVAITVPITVANVSSTPPKTLSAGQFWAANSVFGGAEVQPPVQPTLSDVVCTDFAYWNATCAWNSSSAAV